MRIKTFLTSGGRSVLRNELLWIWLQNLILDRLYIYYLFTLFVNCEKQKLDIHSRAYMGKLSAV